MFTINEIAQAVGGRITGDGAARVGGVSTDTRTIQRGDLYIAIKGENFDGNDFIAQAAENGAAAAISDRAQAADCGIPIILVEDSRIAQLKLARHYRDRFSAKLCAVTGSVGKTSTKDMIYAVLSARFNTLKTEGNFNNDIGLPRTLFRLNEDYGAAVIEMGMSDLGEISALSKAAAPDCAVITNIGYCHIENLKTRENILKAKLEILDGARESAPLILCGDDEYLSTVDITDRRVIRYGFGAECEVRAENIVHLENGEQFTVLAQGERFSAQIPISGEHHILNALAAFCVGRVYGMSAEEIIPAFMDYQASGMRQKTVQRGGLTLILDCYNASPTSMKTSLSVLKSTKAGGRRIAVLGDMLELGEMSQQLHEQVADYVLDSADACFLYGGQMAFCAEKLSESGFTVFHDNDKQRLAESLDAFVREGDVLLFKGSRGMKMEEIAEKIR